MGENVDTGCTLMCSFNTNSLDKLTHQDMLRWLQNDSKLSNDYYQRIVHLEYTDNLLNRTLKITFDGSANCFIAMRQIRNLVLYGQFGNCTVSIACPRGSFTALRLVPKTAEILSKDEVINVLKKYGEIIGMRSVKWSENANDFQIPTGDICVEFLLRQEIPNMLIVRGINIEVIQLKCDILHSDDELWIFWSNYGAHAKVDYTNTPFQISNKNLGCRVIVTYNATTDYRLSLNDVYKWLTRGCGLSEENLRKIIAFKPVTEERYEILFQDGVNCLIAMQEMKNRKISHSHGVVYEAEIICPRGSFVDLFLASDGAGAPLIREVVECALKDYGSLLSYKKSFAVGKAAFDVHCEMFMKTQLPQTLQVNGNEVSVIISEAGPKDYDEKLLNGIWKD